MSPKIRIASFALVSSLLAPVPGWASCHLMEIVEIFGGTDLAPDAHYVVLRMTEIDQILVSGTSVTTSSGTFATFVGNVANGAVGSKILAATAQAESLFGVVPDQTAPGSGGGMVLLDFPDGSAAYSCAAGSEVRYGSVGGSEAPPLVRGCALKWDGFTWTLGDPEPANNAGDTGSAPGSCVIPDAGLPEPPPPLDSGPDLPEPPASMDASSDSPSMDSGLSEPEPPVDASTDTDGEPASDDEGCSCRLATAPSYSPAWLGALWALLSLRRKRARR